MDPSSPKGTEAVALLLIQPLLRIRFAAKRLCVFSAVVVDIACAPARHFPGIGAGNGRDGAVGLTNRPLPPVFVADSRPLNHSVALRTVCDTVVCVGGSEAKVQGV